jgi:hypothetical protein
MGNAERRDVGMLLIVALCAAIVVPVVVRGRKSRGPARWTSSRTGIIQTR